MKVGLPLMKNILKPLAKSILIPIELKVAAAADGGIHKIVLRSRTTALVISNEETKDIMELVKSLDNSGLLIKGITQTIKNETKEQRDGFLGMSLGTLAASLSGNMLEGKGCNSNKSRTKINMSC